MTPPEEIEPVQQRLVQGVKAPVTVPVAAPPADPGMIEQARQSYLAKLLAHIESHKHYPRSARRRGIEGEVEVSFQLQNGGVIDKLQVVGKRRILKKATREAVEAALPMPEPPSELDIPLMINFSMVFSLK